MCNMASETQKCRAKAIELLSRREHSNRELTQKLQRRDYATVVISEVLAKLVVERLLCDERFVECYVRSKSNRGIGPQRLRQVLREHRIDEAIISQYLAEYPWQRLAAEARKKRFGPKIPQEYTDKAKQMRFLQYRGFSLDQINYVMKDE